VELSRGDQEIFDSNGEFADADSSGMVHCVCDGGRNAGEADLSNAAGAERIERQVRMIEEGDVD
jgi:hypothetical protein